MNKRFLSNESAKKDRTHISYLLSYTNVKINLKQPEII